MGKGFLIYEEMRKYFPIYEEAVSHIWLCNCSILNFLIYEENLIFFFISVSTDNLSQVLTFDKHLFYLIQHLGLSSAKLHLFAFETCFLRHIHTFCSKIVRACTIL
jgi:hypothetical protein